MFFYQDFPSATADSARQVERQLLDRALDLLAERRRVEAQLEQLQEENPWLSGALSG
ncbi:hypothetical protein [Kribbella sp. NPDC051770]|uniref:hypothetical protein n=1 Tax=Kribbella sp. NPDC051770 TaxID=3155413 RepID=UPI00341FD6E3